VNLLRKHIHTEDFVVFPMIARCMSDADQRALSQLYRCEEARFGAGFANRCLELLDQMGVLLQCLGSDRAKQARSFRFSNGWESHFEYLRHHSCRLDAAAK